MAKGGGGEGEGDWMGDLEPDRQECGSQRDTFGRENVATAVDVRRGG